MNGNDTDLTSFKSAAPAAKTPGSEAPARPIEKEPSRLITAFHGFSMALADSVPGVSGGTVAFLLGGGLLLGLNCPKERTEKK